jgi:TRAP-type C4-dicarboxylate transport system permease small subunit
MKKHKAELLILKRRVLVSMKAVLKTIRFITEIFNIISMCAMFLMLALVFFNVVFRYLLNSPIPGSFELTRMGMICLTPAMAVTIVNKKCVWVDVISSRFKRGSLLILDALTLPAAAAIWLLIAWQCFVQISKSIEKNVHFTTIMLYEWPFRIVFFIAMSAATLAIIAFTIDRLMQYANGGMPVDETEVEQAIKKAGEMRGDEEVGSI